MPRPSIKPRYKYCRGPDGKNALEHRVRMEKHLGRKLATNEHVHHKNEDKKDNELSNLEVVPAGTHRKYHATKSLPYDVEEAISLYKSGMPFCDIGKKLGTTGSLISQALRNRGVHIVGENYKKALGRKLSWNVGKALELRRRGRSFSSIEKEFGVNPKTISVYFNRTKLF